jgi:hypothetical protein
MVVDVEGFGDPARTNLDQLAIRAALHEALARAFAESGIGSGSCVSRDRGDGALILIPPEIPQTGLVTGLPGMLAAAISRHNTASRAPERMRLRWALHVGEVYRDPHASTLTAARHHRTPGYAANAGRNNHHPRHTLKLNTHAGRPPPVREAAMTARPVAPVIPSASCGHLRRQARHWPSDAIGHPAGPAGRGLRVRPHRCLGPGCGPSDHYRAGLAQW